MDKQFLKQQKEILEDRKKNLEEQVSSFAKKNKKVEGDWVTEYPQFDGGRIEEEADEVEEYGNTLPVSNTLEKELKKVNEALERIEKGKYGKCANCGKEISKGRLQAYPQAKYCSKCSRA